MQQKWMNAVKTARAFLKRNAYGVTLGVCLAVIVGTAVYVRWPQATPQPPQTENIAAGAEDEGVQRLSDVERPETTPVSTPVSTPTVAPLSMAYALAQPACVWPIAGRVTREFSGDTLVYMPTLARYETHAGVDIAGETGTPVAAPMSGTVSAVGEDALWGGSITITHPDGLESTICGVKVNNALKNGLAVRAGETIGTLSGEIAYEAQEGAHIHWALRRDGKPIDPRSIVN